LPYHFWVDRDQLHFPTQQTAHLSGLFSISHDLPSELSLQQLHPLHLPAYYVLFLAVRAFDATRLQADESQTTDGTLETCLLEKNGTNLYNAIGPDALDEFGSTQFFIFRPG
jgi:hypothetical protein